MDSMTARIIQGVLGRMVPDPSRHPGVWDSRTAVGKTLLERTMEPLGDLRLCFPGGVDFERYRGDQQREAAYLLERDCDLLLREGWIVDRKIMLHERAQISFETRRHRPGMRRYLAEKCVRRPERVVERAASLRSRGDGNHYHLLNDILGARVRLMEESGVPRDVAVVVSRHTAAAPVFRRILSTKSLEGREVLVQEHGRIRVKCLYYFESATFNVENARYAAEVLGVPDSDPSSCDRLLIARRSPVMRSVANADEVETLAGQFDFRVVEPAALSLDQQIEMFNRAGIVIGVHGAGLANIMFRRKAPLHLIEIFDRAHAQPAHYMALAQQLGFGYTPLLSASGGEAASGRLVVDCDGLRRALEAVVGKS